jgi:hypothetical protein
MANRIRSVVMLVIVLGAVDAYAESNGKPNILLILSDAPATSDSSL